MAPPSPAVDVLHISAAAEPPPYIIDVREHDEWEAGHIDGALHIPMMEVPVRLAEIPDDREVLVICRSGSRSARVAGFLVQRGVDAFNVSGGMLAWSRAGRPMTGPAGRRPEVL
jgi:rhodanese-related sulfurtransferase